MKSNPLRCKFFQWAEFDDDGNPPWIKKAGENDVRTTKETAEET